ncbi:unnamed protein product [Urochloa humidicola]
MQGDADDAGHYFFFSAPASPVHYILRSPPSSTAASHLAAPADAGDCGCAGDDFEFAARGVPGSGGGIAGAGAAGAAATMSSAEELFVAGRIRVGCLSPIRQEPAAAEGRRREDWEEEEGGDPGEEAERDRDGGGRSPRAARRARSASPPRSPRAAAGGGAAEASDPFASSSSSSSSSSAKSIRRRISLRDLLARTGGDCAGAADPQAPGRPGFWLPSIWPSRSSKKALLPCPAPAPPQLGRRSTSSERAAAPAAGKRAPGGSARRTTSLPYRQGLVLGCLGFGARSYGLAKSMHPLSSR